MEFPAGRRARPGPAGSSNRGRPPVLQSIGWADFARGRSIPHAFVPSGKDTGGRNAQWGGRVSPGMEAPVEDNRTILIESDSERRTQLVHLLHAQGFTVSVAADLATALLDSVRGQRGAEAGARPTLAEIERCAVGIYRLLGCRDFSRIDFRLDTKGVPQFIECNPLPGLSPGYGDLPIMADRMGMSYLSLVSEILSHALSRQEVPAR